MAWQRQDKSLDDFQSSPVLPLGLESGTRIWDKLEALAALVAQAEGREEVLSEVPPLFLNSGLPRKVKKVPAGIVKRVEASEDTASVA